MTYRIILLWLMTLVSCVGVSSHPFDYRGSTIELSGDSGVPTDRVEYSLYGSTTYRAGTNDTPFLFNGRYGVQTNPNGLLYIRARYYNPYLCRFINPDPSGFKGGLNFYTYANGNPVNYFDPFGLNAQATGDSDNSTWLNAYNTVATAVVPGQAAWNNALSAFQNGNYGTAALDTVNMLAQQALFVATLGGSEETTPMLNGTQSAANQVGNAAGTTSSGFGDLTTTEVQTIQQVVDKTGQSVTVVGSAANGTRTAASDIDYLFASSAEFVGSGIGFGQAA